MFELPCVTALAQSDLPYPRDPLVAFEALRADAYPWLLDSSQRSQRLGRFSFAGADPYLVLRARGRRLELDCRRAVRPGLRRGRTLLVGHPLEAVRALLPRLPATASACPLPFAGGALGYLGYELAQQLEPLRQRGLVLPGLDDLGLPDLVLLFVDRLLGFDHRRGRAFAVGLGFGEDTRVAQSAAERAVSELCGRVSGSGRAASHRILRRGGSSARPARAPFAFFDESSYAEAVGCAAQEIARGNVYQACLTQRLEQDCGAEPWSLYRELRRINPAPFASFLELPEVAILSSSPERFVRVDGERNVESRPIKGTRPRGRGPAEDAANRSALAASPKERAENLMIVDLVRNDLGRVCQTGSVDVPELMAIEEYAAVFQMVSTVTGRLREGRDAFDLVEAAFPPGSMTGAPKLAAMEILARLEPVRRGVYSGAIGYFDARGGADLSVVIRTLLLRRGRAYVHAGGGIVADSDPRAEYRETLDKARPLRTALAAAAGRGDGCVMLTRSRTNVRGTKQWDPSTASG